jgi:hypothetical protein
MSAVKLHFAKHTESPVIECNSGKLDMTGVKLLTGATVTVNADGSGKYVYSQVLSANPDGNHAFRNDALSIDNKYISTNYPTLAMENTSNSPIVHEFEFGYVCNRVQIDFSINAASSRFWKAEYSIDNETWVEIVAFTDEDTVIVDFDVHSRVVYIRITALGAAVYIQGYELEADLNCTNVQLPVFVPSSEVSSETSDLVLNQIDISEGNFWQLSNDLTGWSSRTITMLSDEATWEAQAVSANTIYIFDSNGTSAWTWDERNGLVPPTDRISGAVMAKFNVGDNQIRSSVNKGSMKANVNLSWNEESVRAALNRLTALANLVYPIVVEVEDVPEIDLQSAPSGASAATGYTNDIDSVRQSVAATPAIIYTGLLPRENQFSEWLDITVICSDGDGVLQGKLYTVDGTLIETYADLEANPVLTLSNPDYKYSRERMILQISASSETTSTAWSVTKVTWRYQYNG